MIDIFDRKMDRFMKTEREIKSEEAWNIMLEFADQTGVSNSDNVPRRYLWTDAFAVCNFLTLYRQSADELHKNLAIALIDQVHIVLGKYREDDPRTGWISGLSETTGHKHPTAGGLRIGKSLRERGPTDPYDERLEWDRDGQYYHYLTKWMHALERTSMVTGDPKYCRWAVELAKAAHAGFVTTSVPAGSKRMYWKMSTDLSYPLVPSMGHHDPLDGFMTYNELSMCAKKLEKNFKESFLEKEISEMAEMCTGKNWETEDPLGIGGLLFDACRLAQLTSEENMNHPSLFGALLAASTLGLESYLRHNPPTSLAQFRLAFRELGLAIGLKSLVKINELYEANGGAFDDGLYQTIKKLTKYIPLAEMIEDFWRNPPNQKVDSWLGHRDINMVMLATSLSPEEFLSV